MKKIFVFLATLFSLSSNAQVTYVNVTLNNGETIEYKVNAIKEITFFIDDNTSTTDGVHEWVDLGLPSHTKWATSNIGANNPEEYGNYYAWGELRTRSSYTWTTYRFSNDDGTLLRKYNTDLECGHPDNLTELTADDDVAFQEWGEGWTMPTASQIKELIAECEWEWTSINGIMGCIVRSKKNSNSIFLPAAGRKSDTKIKDDTVLGFYWSKSMFSLGENHTWMPKYASALKVYTLGAVHVDYSRCYGISVRAVRTK